MEFSVLLVPMECALASMLPKTMSMTVAITCRENVLPAKTYENAAAGSGEVALMTWFTKRLTMVRLILLSPALSVVHAAIGISAFLYIQNCFHVGRPVGAGLTYVNSSSAAMAERIMCHIV